MYKVLKLTCAVIVLLIRPFVLVAFATVVDKKKKNKNIQESFAKIAAISKTGRLACNTSAKICRCCSFDDPINTVRIDVWKICRKTKIKSLEIFSDK